MKLHWFSFSREEKSYDQGSINWFIVITAILPILALVALIFTGKDGNVTDIIIISTILVLILGFFIHYYKSLVKNYIKIESQLEKFKQYIKDINTIEDFKVVYSEIGKKIQSIDEYISDIWWEFCETLIIKRENNSIPDKNSFDIEDNPIRTIKNTAQTESYINSEMIIDKQVEDRELLESMPGILTGIGLVGTFSAIAVALFGFNLEQIDLSIQNLLGGLSIKFISSLAGILTSILLIYIKNFFFSKIEKQIFEIQRKLNAIFPRRTSESYLCNILEIQENLIEKVDEIHEEIEDQSNSLKQFLTNTDFSDSIKNAVSEGLSNAKPDLIDAINISLEKMDRIKDEIINVLNNLNSSISSSISASVNDSLTQMSNNFNGAISELTVAMNEFKSLKQESAAGIMEKMIAELRICMTDLKTSLTDAVVGGSGDTITSLQNSLKDAGSYLLTVKDTFNGFMENMREQTAQENQQRNEAVTRTIQDTVQKVSDVNTNVQKCIDNQTTQLNVWLETIKSYIDEIHTNEKNVKENYSDLLNKLNSSIISQTKVISDNEQLINELSVASSKIATTSSNLELASSNVAGVIDKTESTSNSLSKSLEVSKNIVERIENTLSLNVQSLTQIQNTVIDLNNTLGSNIANFADKSKDFQEDMFNKFSKGAQDALGNFYSIVNEQAEVIEELSELLERLKR